MTPSRSSSAHPSLLHLKRIGEGVLLLAFAFFVGAITTWLIRPMLIWRLPVSNRRFPSHGGAANSVDFCYPE